MSIIKTSVGRRSFLTSSVMAGGGMMLGFSWLANCRYVAASADEELFRVGQPTVEVILPPRPDVMSAKRAKTEVVFLVALSFGCVWIRVAALQGCRLAALGNIKTATT